MIIKILSRLLGRGAVAFRERSALDEQGLRLGAALVVIKQRGDLMQFAGSRTDMLALITTAVKRGLIAWDLSGERYQLTALDHTHLETYRPAATAAPSPDAAAGSSAAAMAGVAVAAAATSLGVAASALSRSIRARSWHIRSGKAVAAVAGAAAVLGMVVGASISSSRLDRPARSDTPPKAADASASAPAEAAHRTNGGSADQNPTGQTAADRATDKRRTASGKRGPVAETTEAAPGGGPTAGSAGKRRSAQETARQRHPAAKAAAHRSAPDSEETAGGTRALSLQETQPVGHPGQPPAAADRTGMVDQRPPSARQDGLPAKLSDEHAAVPAGGTTRREQGDDKADAASPDRTQAEPGIESSRKAADDAGPAANEPRTSASAEPASPQLPLPAPPVVQHSPTAPKSDAPTKVASGSGPASAGARTRALEKITEALDRHRAAEDVAGDGVRALSLQETPPVDHHRPPSRAEQPKAKNADPAPGARQTIGSAEAPSPAQAGPHNRHAAVSTGRDTPEFDPRSVRSNRVPYESTGWPQPDDDCDLADAAFGPYGWYMSQYRPGVVLRRYPANGRYADGRIAEDPRVYLIYPPGRPYR